MAWREWLTDMGLHIPDSPNVEAIVAATVLLLGAWWVGRLAGWRAAPPLIRALRRWTGRIEGLTEKRVALLLQYGLMTLLLLVAGNSVRLTPISLLIVAAGLGYAVAMLTYQVVKAAGLGLAAAAVLGATAFVATAAGTLGGLSPLVDGLDRVGMTVGTHRVSLLGVVNYVVVAAVLFVLARLANRVLEHAIARLTALDISQRVLVQKLAGILVIVVAVLLGIDLLGIDLTALAVFSGAFGLAVGFGLQKTFGNLISGLILLMDRSVKPGDVIVVGDTFGAVSRIGIRAVSVVTRDGKEHLIPNEQLMTQEVENWSYSSRNVRVHVPVGVSYDSDLKLAQRLMIEAASASARVLSEPRPTVWLTAFGESSVDHDILVWITDPEAGVGNIRSDILNRLWDLFKEHGIEIPFPQRDLHVRSLAFDPSALAASPPNEAREA